MVPQDYDQQRSDPRRRCQERGPSHFPGSLVAGVLGLPHCLLFFGIGGPDWLGALSLSHGLSPASMDIQARNDALQVEEQRRRLDAELVRGPSMLTYVAAAACHLGAGTYHGTLILQNQATMTSPLLDEQGFPRADLDLPAIRAARQAIHRLTNDRHALDEKLRTLLAHAWPSTLAASTPPSATAHAIKTAKHDGIMARPIAVRSVAANSPAAQCGLQAGDELVRWGSIYPVSSEHFHEISALVKEGESIAIEVRRIMPDGRTVHVSLHLVPASGWGGRGLLGCHIVPT